MMDCPTGRKELYWVCDDEFEDLDGGKYIEQYYNCDRCFSSVTVTTPSDLDYSNIPALGEE